MCKNSCKTILTALKREINCGERYVSIEVSWLKRLKGAGFAFDCVSVKISLWSLAGFVIGKTEFKAHTLCKKATAWLPAGVLNYVFETCLFCHSCILTLSLFFVDEGYLIFYRETFAYRQEDFMQKCKIHMSWKARCLRTMYFLITPSQSCPA